MKTLINSRFSEHQSVVEKFLRQESNIQFLETISILSADTLRKGNSLLFAGNGGSFSQAQHFASELSGKFQINRDPLNAIALGENPSYLSATSNDYNFEDVFARAIQAHGRKGDVLFLLSTSGSSPNILNSIPVAKEKGIITVAMTGIKGQSFANSCDYSILVPDSNTARIQEIHLICGHIICELIENNLFT